MKQDLKIDFVITWVDGNDLEWQKEREKYFPRKNEDASVNRYREWGILHFWFRSVEKYAPWVNNIYFITCGHVPSWLNLEHPKLHLVKHSDYIPKQYLPTFSTRAIEFHMHRIVGLSEHFVNFNDDMFLAKPCKPTDFFKKGLPLDSAICNPLSGGELAKIMINNLDELNRNFRKNRVIRKSMFKWINFKYGVNFLRTLLLMPWPHFTGFHEQHQPQPFLKSTFFDLWEHCEEKLVEVSNKKFRTHFDVNPYLFRWWQLAKGNFSPAREIGQYVELGLTSLDLFKKNLERKKKRAICLNDQLKDPLLFEGIQKELIEIFESQFPQKSLFEK